VVYDVYKEIQNPSRTKWKGIAATEFPPTGLFIDETLQEIIIRFESIRGMTTLKTHPLEGGMHEFYIKVEEGRESKWILNKTFHEMTGTSRDSLFQKIVLEIQKVEAIPEIDGIELNNRPDVFVENLQTLIAQHHDLLREKTKEWIKITQEENIPSWFKVSGEYDFFDEKMVENAMQSLTQNNVIDQIYPVIELKAVAQKPKAILEFLIALSSIFENPIHSLITANPGKSKSTISSAVFELFPRQRRIKFNKTSSVAGLLNMTKYKEGSGILAHKLIKVGDFGDTSEQEQSADIISLLKELMSEGEYDKILTDMLDESGRAMILKLRGCGSVHMEIISPTAEAQYMSRSLVWSPDDSRRVQDSIMEYQEDEIRRVKKAARFKHCRLGVACLIEQIFLFVEELRKDGGFFEILNPYTSHFNGLLRVKDSPNANRDRIMVQTIPKIVTLANCYSRDVYYNEGLDTYALIVSFEDYIYTLKNLGRTLSHFVHKKPEVLKTYTTIISEKLNKCGLSYDDLRWCGEELAKDKNIHGEDGEVLDAYRDCRFYTYDDIAKFTTVQAGTVRKHVKELADLKIVYVDRGHRPNKIYVPKDFDDQKRRAWKGIFDYGASVLAESGGENGLKPNPFSLDESYIFSIYTEYLKILEHEGWLKVPICFVRENHDDLGVEDALIGDG
jgi:hypothetical protein